ncbi:arabinose-proton symporter-like [Rhagoletis pomonella]|uniref:arabinose-proton symporter-like n=1 Tax=Rhagoletis pomonella TaxID=28610 RepID=UPI0017826E66|nr:arabinose-proton symporter-like [Rhagoletis pomonella]
MTTINSIENRGRFSTDLPQSNALLSEVFVFITGGFHLAVSVGWSFIAFNLHFQVCWFIGIAIGCVLAPLLALWKYKRLIIFSPILMVNVSAIVSITASSNTTALIAARYLNGIAIGLITVSFIADGSEIASEYHRSFCLALEQLALAIGAFIQIIYTATWREDTDFNPYCLQGIFCIVFGIIATALTFTSIDSPVLQLRRGDEPEALNCVIRLYRPTIMNNSKQAIFNKLKEYVAMNESMSPGMSFLGSLSPLIRLLVYRTMLSFIVALPITKALNWSADISVGGLNVNWPPILYGFLTLLGVVVGTVTNYAIGRKAVSLISLLCVAGLTIGVGVIFHDSTWLIDSTQMAIACTLLMIAQIFGGIFAPSTTIYLGEAFPLQWKRCFIAFTVFVQYMVDLIIVCTFTFDGYNEYIFCISAGVIMFAGVVFLSITIPETRKATLREAQEKFSYALHLEFY